MDCRQSLHVQTCWCMGKPDPSAREIMGNRQAGQRCSLCLHNEQHDGARGQPEMCSGDGVLSGCLNKASPSPVLFFLGHPCLPDSLSFMSLAYFLPLLFFSLSCFDVCRITWHVKPEEPSKVKTAPFCMTLKKECLKYLLNCFPQWTRRKIWLDVLKLFSPVEYIKEKLTLDKYRCITAIVRSSSLIWYMEISSF